jgi:hypothetical protein
MQQIEQTPARRVGQRFEDFVYVQTAPESSSPWCLSPVRRR